MTRKMQPFNFKVMPSGSEGGPVPVTVAGQTMMDVQKLLSDVGAVMIRQEMRLQGDIPEPMMKRFDLSMDLSAGRDVGAVTEGEDTLMLDALNRLMRELDIANMHQSDPEPGNQRDALARRAIASDLLALAEHLEGYDLFYGKEQLRKFRFTRRDALRKVAEDTSLTFPGAVIGVICQSPVRRDRWVLSNGAGEAPVTFSDGMATEDIKLFSESGPLIVSGTVVTDGSGNLVEMRNASSCHEFPSVWFHRIITPSRDIVLLNPAVAVPGYNRHKNKWTLDCDDLGISVSKESWDEAVLAFHEYFAFLWETYAESDDEFEGEEEEIRQLLLSMVPMTVE